MPSKSSKGSKANAGRPKAGPAKGRPGRPKAPRDPRSFILWGVMGLVGAALAAVVVVALTSNGTPGQTSPKLIGHVGEPVPASIMKDVTQIPYSVWGPVGTSAASPPQVIKVVKGTPSAPNLLYIGAEWCPYCAAERWVLTSALSRFGTFSGMHLMQSSSSDVYPATKTLTFYKSQYHSAYIHVSLNETAGNTPNASGNYPTLDKLTPAEAAIQSTYDKPPYVPTTQQDNAIPFVLVGNKYLWLGAQYTPPTIGGLSWSQIASDMRHPTGSVGQTILAATNELTAAICATDHNQPGSVCDTPVIKKAEGRL